MNKLSSLMHRWSTQAALAMATLAMSGAALAQQAEGEIKSIDLEAGKVVIKHDKIPEVDMPAMRAGMSFRVKDPAWLKNLQPGDKVKFSVERIDSYYTVTAIEKK